ncbi:MAG: hypothetical protein ACJAZO_004581 [Myxococcota bacterium]|jgi:hypothetical protein
MNRNVLLLVCLAFVGCTLAEDAAPDSLASVWCGKKRRCDRADFENTWDNRAECEDDIAAAIETTQDFYDLLGCEWDGRGAAKIRADIRGKSCSEFAEAEFEGSAELYDCGG